MQYPPANMNDNNSSSDDSNDNIDVNENPMKKTRGRQKIEMRKIEKESDKMITFSKRRGGIYKKASELVAMTGCKIEFLVFSPAGKAFTFAHPSFDYIANRFRRPEQVDPSPMAENINIEGDATMVNRHILDRMLLHPLAGSIAQECIQLLQAHNEIRCFAVKREANFVAHKFAKHALTMLPLKTLLKDFTLFTISVNLQD